MEEEVRDILRNAVGVEGRPTAPLGSRLRQRFERIGLDEDIKELHRQKARPTVFEG
jgi:plasmid stability protein